MFVCNNKSHVINLIKYCCTKERKVRGILHWNDEGRKGQNERFTEERVGEKGAKLRQRGIQGVFK